MYAQHRHLSSGIGRRAVWPARQAAVGSGLRTTRPLVHAVPGPTSLTVKVKAEPLPRVLPPPMPRVLPPRDGACLKDRFRAALLGTDATHRTRHRSDHLGEEPALGTFSPSACAVLTCFAEHPTVAAMLFSSRNAVGMLRDVAP